MSTPFESPAAQFAVSAVREASQLVRRVQAEMVTEAISKEDKSPVTVADFAAQAVVAHRLQQWDPAAVLVGEESASALREESGRATLAQITQFVASVVPEATSDAVCDWIDRGDVEPPAEFWTLDPVDGTKGFLRGDQYAVAFALVKNGRVEIGALGCPELEDAANPAKGGRGSLVIAVRGAGVRTQPLDDPDAPWTELKVADVAAAADARMLRSVEKAHTDTGGIGALVSKLGVTADPVPLDSQAKYAVLAAGGGDVLLRLLSPSRPDYREKIWDQAAGSIVVEEAGGRVSDLDGKPLDFSHGRTLAANRGVLATNGPLHDAFLAGLKAIDA
ncbi:MAG: 3'(2'),5'-bisphosphate nucleotidase [Planctomycetales bacterium]|nr:3'(2'),5'-bisphosphate nucleotidase [Planctomycetales bacterium]